VPGKNDRTFLLSWGPVVLYCGIIFLFSSRAGTVELPGSADKIIHFFEYFILAYLIGRGLAERKWSLIRRAVVVFWAASCYAATDEIHQSFVPGRNPSIYDWFADVAGISGMITLMLSRVKWRGAAVKYHYETT
jgi:hypothetical protein